jgi:hypothetical protein
MLVSSGNCQMCSPDPKTQSFETIYQQADKTSKMISGLITYLINNEKAFKQKKQDKLKKLNKPD